MEDPLVRQPITSHNAHSLMDTSNDDIDEGGDRPASNSSESSREMDASSPVDEGRNSKECLDEETRYQTELKDRVRRSYVNLGMEPEGILLKGDDKEEVTSQDSIKINENMNYGKIKAANRDNISDQHLEEEEANGQLLNGSNNASNEYSHDLSYADDIEEATARSEIEGKNLSNNNVSSVLPPCKSEDVKPVSAARTRSNNQNQILDYEYTEAEVSADGGNPRGDDNNPRLSPHHGLEGQFTDSLEIDHRREELENLQDSLEDEIPVNTGKGIIDEEERRGDGDDDAFRDSLEDMVPQEEPFKLQDSIHGSNMNNNAASGGSPPVGSKSGRSYADVADQGSQDDGYTNNDIEDRRVDVSHRYHEDSYPNEDVIPRGTATEDESYSTPRSNKHYHPSSRQEHQGSQEDYAEIRDPPIPPPMPPEPPPPVLNKKPPSAGVGTRPTTNPFRVESQQGEHQSMRYTPTHRQADTLSDRHQLPSNIPHSVNKGIRSSSPRPQGEIASPESNPYHDDFLNHSAVEQPPQAFDDQLGYGARPPPQSQPHHPQNGNPSEEHQLSESPSRISVSPRQEPNPSRTPLHMRAQEKSYLNQFREKQRSPDENRNAVLPGPGRTVEDGGQVSYPKRHHPERTLESQKGFQGYGRNSRGLGPKEDDTSSAQGVSRRNTIDRKSSSASLESLRFQALPRENSLTKANYQEGKLVKMLPSGEKLHVAYISDDSDDEDMHFVDEMGNPIDTDGKLLTKCPSPAAEGNPKLEYRIKPAPPRQKSTSELMSPSSGKRIMSGGRIVRSGKATAGARRQNTMDRAVGESKAPSPETYAGLVAEEEFTKSTVQMEGELNSTLPGSQPPSAPFNDPPSSSNIPLLGEVMVTSLQGQPQYGYPPNMNPAMQMAYQMPQQFIASHQVPGQVMLANQPTMGSPGASYSFVPQVYAQIQTMNPMQTILQPVMSHPQVYIGGPPQFMPAQVQQGPNIYGAPQQGQGILQGGGGVIQRGGRSQEERYSEGEDDEEDDSQQQEDSVFLESEQSGRRGKHPRGVRGLLADRYKDSKPKRQIPKPGKNFIDANKSNVKNVPRDKKYKDMYGNTKSNQKTLIGMQPLPNISQDEEESSGEDHWAHREDVNGYDEGWARQLVDEQRMMAVLKRNHSVSNVLDHQANMRDGFPPGRQGYVNPNAHRARTSPPDANWKNADGQPYSYSADRAVSYGRLRGPGPEGYRQTEDGRRYSDGERFAYTQPMPTRYSPYNVLPEIQGEEEGYLMKMQQQRKPPAYKEYTVKDYRALKRNIKLGGLGPDPDVVLEKQEKAQRQREYARAIMDQNKKNMKKAAKPWTPPKEEPTGHEMSRRGAALRYAKNVPKPPLRVTQEELHARLYRSKSEQDDSRARDGAKTYMMDETARLEELAERHRQEREEIERLRSGSTP